MHPNPALSVLYVLTECIHTEGYLTTYKVDPSTGGMRELGRVTLTGRSSCYISFDKYAHHAIITNYWDGLINVVELSPAGVPLRVVQEHQQTRRSAWRQVENREVRPGCAGLGGVLACECAGPTPCVICAGLLLTFQLTFLRPCMGGTAPSTPRCIGQKTPPPAACCKAWLAGRARVCLTKSSAQQSDLPPCTPAAADCVLQDHMANRQDGPHAHCNVFHPSYNWVFVPDLGDNAIHQYGYKDGRLTSQCHVALPPGEGPRHFVFHPTLPVAYSGCELLSRVQVRAQYMQR